MKKILFLVLFLSFGTSFIFAQTELVTVFGIDYTTAKVYGAKESPEKFQDAFIGINDLLISESKKYNFSKVVDAEIKISVETVLKKTTQADFKELKTYSKKIAPVDVENLIKEYPIEEKKGKGLIVFGLLLNKVKKNATYKVVLFDIASRKVLETKDFTGKAGGFGLRNYWARTVFLLTKRCKLLLPNKK